MRSIDVTELEQKREMLAALFAAIMVFNNTRKPDPFLVPETVALYAVSVTDALLAALAKPKE